MRKPVRRNHLKSHRLLLAVCLLPFVFSVASAQEVVDKMVASINGKDLITYTDLLWQLALQPDTPLDNPRSDDLNAALQRLIDQLLIDQEAEKLPSVAAKDEEIKNEINALIKRFPSQEAFYQRLARVGLTSEQLQEIARERVEINNYLDFRFRSFTVITPQEIANYYRDVYAPRWRKQSPGRIVPTLEQASAEIAQRLTESKVASDIDSFLDDARARAEIVILSSV